MRMFVSILRTGHIACWLHHTQKLIEMGCEMFYTECGYHQPHLRLTVPILDLLQSPEQFLTSVSVLEI